MSEKGEAPSASLLRLWAAHLGALPIWALTSGQTSGPPGSVWCGMGGGQVRAGGSGQQGALASRARFLGRGTWEHTCPGCSDPPSVPRCFLGEQEGTGMSFRGCAEALPPSLASSSPSAPPEPTEDQASGKRELGPALQHRDWGPRGQAGWASSGQGSGQGQVLGKEREGELGLRRAADRDKDRKKARAAAP